jgi:3'5'-cyclic nucleotide phosphodiesterase/Adenylate and Guanylate cyclase catalytic domain
VNTAARMESTGIPSRIHLSEDIANLLIDAGKSELVQRREKKVNAKGKGELQTFWLVDPNNSDDTIVEANGGTKPFITCTKSGEVASPRGSGTRNKLSNTNSPSGRGNLRAQLRRSVGLARLGDLETRLTDYNVEVLQQLIKKLVASRVTPVTASQRPSMVGKMPSFKGLGGRSPRMVGRKNSKQKGGINSASDHDKPPVFIREKNKTILDEAVDVISFSETLGRQATSFANANAVELKPEVAQELHHFVKTLSSMYRFNAFHNFEHASHATQSMVKQLARVTAEEKKGSSGEASFMVPIKSDPLTQFGMVFACLIHDVDHYGIPNSQMFKERGDIAETYGCKSIAEQSSVDVAWDLLMGSDYQELRACIYTSQAELNHFRQVVVNCVLATDVSDKDLAESRRKRWTKAFTCSGIPEQLSAEKDADRKATLVMEHMMQASNMAHSMQHWHVYLKWNEKLFAERFKSFVAGREESDPSLAWYEAELVHFDSFIIPLTLRLKDAGVFGNACEEYLNYARTNRREWENKGAEIVQKYLDTYQDRPSFFIKA